MPTAILALQQSSTGANSVSFTSLLFQLVVGLVFVVGLIAVIARVSKGRVGRLRRSSSPLAVLGRQTLGKGVHVAIVKAGEDTYLLGVTQHQVTRIGKIDLPEDLLPVDSSSDDLPPAESAANPARTTVPSIAGRWQAGIRQLQDRTVRRS